MRKLANLIRGSHPLVINKNTAYSAVFSVCGGDKGIRTPGLCVANASLYQLSHAPRCVFYSITFAFFSQLFFFSFFVCFLRFFIFCLFSGLLRRILSLRITFCLIGGSLSFVRTSFQARQGISSSLLPLLYFLHAR